MTKHSSEMKRSAPILATRIDVCPMGQQKSGCIKLACACSCMQRSLASLASNVAPKSKQALNNVNVPIGSCKVKDSHAISTTIQLQLSTLGQEKLNSLNLIGIYGSLQCCAPIPVGCIDVRRARKQAAEQLHMTRFGCYVKSCLAVDSSNFEVCPKLNKFLNNLDLVVGCSCVERSHATAVEKVYIMPLLH
jgi:hypothetical protein